MAEQKTDGRADGRSTNPPDEVTEKIVDGAAEPRHTVRDVHEQAEEEQRQLGRKVDQQVDPDRHARWRGGAPRAADMPIDTQPPASGEPLGGSSDGGKSDR